MLAEKLNMNTNDAERWIVNLIKNARLDAKIDSKRGHVVMSDQATNPHQQVIDKTKNLQVSIFVLKINSFSIVKYCRILYWLNRIPRVHPLRLFYNSFY